jgi:hypothetical protein
VEHTSWVSARVTIYLWSTQRCDVLTSCTTPAVGMYPSHTVQLCTAVLHVNIIHSSIHTSCMHGVSRQGGVHFG